MKNRLSITIPILLLAGFMISGAVLAKGGKGDRDGFSGPPGATQKLARMSEHLGLSPEQEAAMLLILQENEAQRAAFHDQVMLMLGPDICAHRLEVEEQILGVLDTDQAELFEQQKQERAERAEERGQRRGAGIDCSQYEDSDG